MASAATPEGASGRQLPRNAFHSRFLELIDEREEPVTAAEADVEGPWTVAPHTWHGAPGYGVFRTWEDPRRDEPRAWFVVREMALAAAALLPATGKEDWFELSTQATPAGHRLEQHGRLVGYLPLFEERLQLALHFAECLMRSPVGLASLLVATSPLALRRAGEILARGLAPESEAGAAGATGP